MKKTIQFLAIALVASTISFFACQKADRDEDTETQTAVDNATADMVFQDAMLQVMHYADTVNVYKLTGLACDTAWLTPAFPDLTFPKTLTIRFDTVNGCTDPYGTKRKGKIRAIFSNKNFLDSLAVVTLTFDEYYVEGYKLSGSQTITNNGRIAGIPTFTVKTTNAKITTPGLKTITWNSNETKKWTAGATTPSVWGDDIFSVTGTASGIGTKGTNYSLTVSSALVFDNTCRWITQGIIEITPGNLPPRTVDFGSGTCDNTATVTFTGKTFSVTLP